MEKTSVLSTHRTIFQKSIYSVNENKGISSESTVSHPSSSLATKSGLFFFQNAVKNLPSNNDENNANLKTDMKSLKKNEDKPSAVIILKDNKDFEQTVKNVNDMKNELTGEINHHEQSYEATDQREDREGEEEKESGSIGKNENENENENGEYPSNTDNSLDSNLPLPDDGTNTLISLSLSNTTDRFVSNRTKRMKSKSKSKSKSQTVHHGFTLSKQYRKVNGVIVNVQYSAVPALPSPTTPLLLVLFTTAVSSAVFFLFHHLVHI